VRRRDPIDWALLGAVIRDQGEALGSRRHGKRILSEGSPVGDGARFGLLATPTRRRAGAPSVRWVRSLGLLPSATWGAAAELVVTAAVDDVRAGEVAQRRAEYVHQTGERPHCEHCDRGQAVELEADWRSRHQLRMQRELEDAAEPHGHHHK
jgi:hypothetical protein